MSKLSNKYPKADIKKWLNFMKNWQTDIDPIFAGRLAALAKDNNKVININSGKRSTTEQIISYRSTGGYQDKNGNWVGGSGFAAVPGRSWHEFGQAIDTIDVWLKQLEKDESTENQKTLRKYGLFKPLTKGNQTSICEDWHIQPIETDGQANNKKVFLDGYKKNIIKKIIDKIIKKK
jgi:hypothetical protein